MLLPALLGGCAAFRSTSAPSPVAVAIPPDCESILQTVPYPPPVKAGDDMGVAVARRGSALRTANGRIDAGRQCAADQRRAYGSAK